MLCRSRPMRAAEWTGDLDAIEAELPGINERSFFDDAGRMILIEPDGDRIVYTGDIIVRKADDAFRAYGPNNFANHFEIIHEGL